MAHLEILGEALIMEYDSVVLKSLGLEEGYQPYYFLGKNIKVDQEDIEKHGKDDFFVLYKGNSNLVFTKRYLNGICEKENDIANMIPCNKELNWDDPMFIICIERGEWVIKPTTEGEKYLE